MTVTQHIKGLKVAAAILMATGVLVFFGSHPVTAWPTLLLADLLIWPLDGMQMIPDQTSRLLAAISGGVMVGWGLLIWLIATTVFEKAPEDCRRIVLTSIVVWAVFDSTGSVMAGVPLNIGGNLLYVLMFFWVLRTPNARNVAA